MISDREIWRAAMLMMKHSACRTISVAGAVTCALLLLAAYSNGRAVALSPYQPRATFLVLFDFDSSAISAAGEAVIGEMLAELQYYTDVLISVYGHADRSGPEDYNVALAMRRAEAVRAVLIARGVKPSAIVKVGGRGESEPAVPTPDGVKEAANRRVEINLME